MGLKRDEYDTGIFARMSTKEAQKWRALLRLGAATDCPECCMGFIRGRRLATTKSGLTIEECPTCKGVGYVKK